MSSVFVAQYGGRCAVCDHGVRPGDDATYLDDELVHADCVHGTIREAASPRPMCPVCFTEFPLTGVCGNCT